MRDWYVLKDESSQDLLWASKPHKQGSKGSVVPLSPSPGGGGLSGNCHMSISFGASKV